VTEDGSGAIWRFTCQGSARSRLIQRIERRQTPTIAVVRVRRKEQQGHEAQNHLDIRTHRERGGARQHAVGGKMNMGNLARRTPRGW